MVAGWCQIPNAKIGPMGNLKGVRQSGVQAKVDVVEDSWHGKFSELKNLPRSTAHLVFPARFLGSDEALASMLRRHASQPSQAVKIAVMHKIGLCDDSGDFYHINDQSEAALIDWKGTKKKMESYARRYAFNIGLIWADGDKKGGLALQCDKNDYRGILAGLEGVSGKKAVDSETMTVKNWNTESKRTVSVADRSNLNVKACSRSSLSERPRLAWRK
jgi:hypothetical protein